MYRRRLNTVALEAVTNEDAAPAANTVEAVDNHIYFYADVTNDRVLAAIKLIREADNRLRWERVNRETPSSIAPTPIWLHINSGGGDLLAGFAFADMLDQVATPVYSIAEGLCASAATLIAMACQKRYSLPNAVFLIHQLSSGIWGTHEQFKDELVVQNILMTQLETFYVKHSAIQPDAVREMFKRDTWFSVQEALNLKLIDALYKRGQ